MKTRLYPGMLGHIIILAVFALFAGSAFATGGGDKDCDHPRFLEKGCGYEGKDGKDGRNGHDGKDGRDGIDGKDGKDGINGKDGKDGRDGIDGKDGVVDETWINETRNWQSKWIDYAAATEAIQIHLPQDRKSRLTGGISRIHGQSGFGLGYAFMTDRDDNLAFTVGVGTSGGEQVGKASVGFEFGADRKSYSYDDARLERRIQDLQLQLDGMKARCRESTDRAYKQCVSK